MEGAEMIRPSILVLPEPHYYLFWSANVRLTTPSNIRGWPPPYPLVG